MRGGLRAALAVVVTGLAAFVAGVFHAQAAASPPVRVTVFGDSVATAMQYDPSANRMLSRGVDLRLETAACRRVGDTSCPYKGETPPNVIDRATELGSQLGPVVVVAVGYNDYEANYAKNIDDAMAAFRKAGVQHVLWLTLLASRASWANMNAMIAAAGRKYPEITVLDWDALAKPHPDWFQPTASPHLTAAGAQGMAGLIEDALVRLAVVAPQEPPQTRRLLAIASRALPAARVGRRYAARLKAVGGTAPYRWRRTSGALAPGLRLASTGRVTGVPRRTGTFKLRVRVVDGSGTARARVLSLRVA
jgi:hypothetical protein